MRLRHRYIGGLPTAVAHDRNLDRNQNFQMVSSGWSRKHFVKALSHLLIMAIATVSFGTIYSNVTSRDACQVLQEFRRESVPQDFPRLLHFQSRTLEMTEQTKTWFEVLQISSPIQEYPTIKSDNSTWRAVYWSDDSCKSLVEHHFPAFSGTYNSFPHNIQRVDSCRYLILSMFGGVYADTDISIHASDANEFEYLIPDGVGLVESPYRYNEVWQNSLMTASYPGHCFWNLTIEITMERSGDGIVLSSTGPKMIGDAVARFRNVYVHDNGSLQDVHTLPCELFQRLPLGDWNTTFMNIIGREVLARAVPMKGCGKYANGRCEITRHTGKASWTKDAGLV